MIEEKSIRKIVKEAVEETLSGLGFDLSHRHQLQSDFIYLRALRMRTEEVQKRFRHALIMALTPAMLWVLWQTFRWLAAA